MNEHRNEYDLYRERKNESEILEKRFSSLEDSIKSIEREIVFLKSITKTMQTLRQNEVDRIRKMKQDAERDIEQILLHEEESYLERLEREQKEQKERGL